MSTTFELPVDEPRPVESGLPVPVPCAAHPGTGFVHLDGACHCFAGGPAPEFAPPLRLDSHGS